MPYIKFYNLTNNKIQDIYNNSITLLSEKLNTPIEKFSFINAGNIINNSNVVIEILWMPRSKEMQELIFEILSNEIDQKVIINFTNIDTSRYYI